MELNGGGTSQGLSHFHIAREQDGGNRYLRLSGEFDIACRETFEHEVQGVLRDRPAGVIIDLRDLEFIDSTGLRLLVQADGLCRESGIECGVMAGNGAVRRTFDLTGMDEVLQVIPGAA